MPCPASPANIHVWGKSETPSYPLCSRRCSLEHFLSSCPKALAVGRYHWHHKCSKQSLRVIASAINNRKHHNAPKKVIPFIKAGEKPQTHPQTMVGLLHTAPEWQLQVNLGKYQERVEECRGRGWRTLYKPIEDFQDAHSVKPSISWMLLGQSRRGP